MAFTAAVAGIVALWAKAAATSAPPDSTATASAIASPPNPNTATNVPAASPAERPLVWRQH